jgi:hypothetical protein
MSRADQIGPAVVGVVGAIGHGVEVCQVHSFNPDTFSEYAVCTNPSVNAPAIIANLKSVALSGFDEMNVLETVNLAQNDVTNLKIARARRNNGA